MIVILKIAQKMICHRRGEFFKKLAFKTVDYNAVYRPIDILVANNLLRKLLYTKTILNVNAKFKAI